MWEIVIKQGMGKLQLPEDWADILMREPFGQLPINFQHALTVGKLPAIHKDPFDRLLAAHSEARRTPLCSLDRQIRSDHRLLVKELRS